MGCSPTVANPCTGGGTPPPSSGHDQYVPPPVDTGQERYEKIGAEVRRVLAVAKTHASPQARLEAYTHARDLYRQQQAIQDSHALREAIAQAEAMITWYGGVQEVGNKNYLRARDKLMAAYKARPELFTDADFKYIAEINQRLLATQPNMSRAIVLQAPEAVEKPVERTYVPSGNGLIGGTTWIAGYNVPAGSSPELRAHAKKRFREQAVLAGIPYNEAVDFDRFSFVLGIASSTAAFTDLRKRVLFDNLSAGKATPQIQSAYNSLKGRSFDELDCHSNGAMICLAALENKDIVADRVVLYGPQITPESLALWQQLIKSRRVRSVQIYLNQNDPVPAVAMAFSAKAALNVGLLDVKAMDRFIKDSAPSIGVKVFSCGGLVPTLECHDLRAYKTNRGCNKTSSGEVVPGTALPGGRGLLEPPPPC